MRGRSLWAIGSVILGAFATGTLLQAQNEDQSKPPTYTYVATWAVPRAQWADMQKVNATDRSTLDKFLADGTIAGYGEFENFIHTPNEPTHGSWFTANSEGNILKVLGAFYAQPDSTAPVLAASKHADIFLISHLHGARAGTFDNAYLSGSTWQVKPGQAHAFRDLLKTRVGPILDKLIGDDTLVSYSVDGLFYDTDRPGSISLVTITASPSAQDKLDQAIEDAFGKDPEIGPAMGSLTNVGEHRDFLYHVIHMVNK